VRGARSEANQGVDMLRGAVSLVLGEPVPREGAVQFPHEPVAGDFATMEAAAIQAHAASPRTIAS